METGLVPQSVHSTPLRSAPLGRLDCNESSQSKRDLIATAGEPALATCPVRDRSRNTSSLSDARGGQAKCFGEGRAGKRGGGLCSRRALQTRTKLLLLSLSYQSAARTELKRCCGPAKGGRRVHGEIPHTAKRPPMAIHTGAISRQLTRS